MFQIFAPIDIKVKAIRNNKKKQIKRKRQFKTVSRNEAFYKTDCGDFLYFTVCWEDSFAK